MLIEPQFRTKFGDAAWSTKARLHRMLVFEQCMANGQAKFGLIPAESAHTINSVQLDSVPAFFEVFNLATTSGNPAIPFVNCLRNAVTALNPNATSHVHLGTTSQDLLDTTMMLALANIFDEISVNLMKIEEWLIKFTTKYKSSPAIARTLHQHATPTTFGLKSATWALGVHEARKRLERTRSEELSVQLGGAAGVLTLMKPHGASVRAYMATNLELVDPGYSWHTNRSRVLSSCSALVQVSGVLAKIAKDCLLMMQTEIAELTEGIPGNSSAMPHKNNPVGPLVPLAALPIISEQLSTISAVQAHSHERAAGNWHTEWIVIPSISSLTLASVEKTLFYLSDLRINESQMAKNLDFTGGILGAAELQHLLAEALGHNKANEFLQFIFPTEGEQTFAQKALANAELVKTLGKRKIQEILSYKGHIEESEREALSIIEQISRT